MRGNENFFVPEDKTEYFWKDNKILPFSAKVAYTGCFISVVLDRSYTVYIIDPFEKFEVINVYTPPGKLEFQTKDQFFKGIGVLKSMLSF